MDDVATKIVSHIQAYAVDHRSLRDNPKAPPPTRGGAAMLGRARGRPVYAPLAQMKIWRRRPQHSPVR